MRRDYHILKEGQLGYNALIHQEAQCKECKKRIIGHVIRVYIPHSCCAICGTCVDNACNFFEALLLHAAKEHHDKEAQMFLGDDEGGEVVEDG